MKHLPKIILAIIFLLTGYLISQEINSFLGITFEEKDLNEVDVTTRSGASSQSELRLVDMGGVGIVADSSSWGGNYSHNVRRFEDMWMADPPFIDTIAFKRVFNELELYLDRMSSYGFNGIIIPGFLEFVTFDLLNNGKEIYPENDIYRQRHIVLRSYFQQFVDLAKSKDFSVYLYTDMVTLTPPLERYLKSVTGGRAVDTRSEKLWEVYQMALREIFETMPDVAGLMIRIGEAGTVYNEPGWDYYSELYVQDDDAVQIMLQKLLEVAEAYDKTLIFRSWSVGVGKVGDMHTNPQTYERVLEGISSENLVISTKYSNGDFYSWLPFNHTLYTGSHKRIVEYQCRREFDGFNAFPNYVAPVHQRSLKNFAEANPNIMGMWVWTQEGGPLRAGPMSAFPFFGFNAITDASVYAMGRLSKNCNEELGTITEDWVKNYFGENPLLVQNLSQLLLMSHDVTVKGLYIGEFAKYYVKALGLEPPPMLWIFEWDIVTGSSSALGSIYFVCQNNIEEAITEGFMAVEGVKKMRILAEESAGLAEKNQEDYVKLLESLDYQENLFTVLAHYRKLFLHYYNWLNTGNSQSEKIWKYALKDFERAEALHRQRYSGNLDFPAYNFREAKVGLNIKEKSGSAAGVSVGWLALVLISIVVPVALKGKSRLADQFCRFWNGLIFPERGASAFSARSNEIAVTTFALLMPLLGLIIFTSYSAPVFTTYLFILMLTYLLQLIVWYRSGSIEIRFGDLLPLMPPALILLLVPVALSAFRAPMLFWFEFWTSAGFRTFFFTFFIFFVLWSYYMIFAKARYTFNYSIAKSTGILLLITGIQLSIGFGIILLTGFENFLTLVNDELLVLPGGLSRILGITVHLNIPPELPFWVFITGIFMTCGGFLLRRLVR